MLEEKTDVLIIGAGAAGIRAAIEASKQKTDVILTTKGPLCRDGAATWMAGNAFQAAFYSPDSVETHVKDTIIGGKYLNNQKIVKTFLSRGPQEVEKMDRWGARFVKKDEKFFQISFPGHSYPRSVCGKPGLFLGPEYKKTLLRQVKNRKIRVDEDIFVTALLHSDTQVVGAIGLDIRRGEIKLYRAKATILATGGFMGCYELTTANPTATGDGHAMAYRAGVKMMDMEFIQFIPTATLWPPTLRGDPYPYLLWVSLHPIFYNSFGERFLERYYPDVKDWATREAVTRAIVKEVGAGRGSPHGGAYMSFRHLPRNLIDHFLEKAQGVHYLEKLKETGLDLREDAIEVAPGTHYVQGGCWINEKCETNQEGLYAAGEIGSGGKDGADRLAGNSITFCLAMGSIAGLEASKRVKEVPLMEIDRGQVDSHSTKILSLLDRTGGKRPVDIKKAVRKIMSTYVFLERNEGGLRLALKRLSEIRERDLPFLATVAKSTTFNLEWVDGLEVINMVDVAELVCETALMRTESRGLHQRTDYPKTNPDWLRHITIEKMGGEMKLSTEPVDLSLINPDEEASRD